MACYRKAGQFTQAAGFNPAAPFAVLFVQDFAPVHRFNFTSHRVILGGFFVVWVWSEIQLYFGFHRF